MPRWNEFDEAELRAKEQPPQIHGDTIARLVIGLEDGGKCGIIADCRVFGNLKVVWTKDCAAALVVLEQAVNSLRRMHQAADGIYGAAKPTDETQLIPPPTDPRGTPQARLMRLLFGREYKDDSLETIRSLAAAEIGGDGEWLPSHGIHQERSDQQRKNTLRIAVNKMSHESGQECPRSIPDADEDVGSPWCEPCHSWHPTPRDRSHHAALQCRAEFVEPSTGDAVE